MVHAQGLQPRQVIGEATEQRRVQHIQGGDVEPAWRSDQVVLRVSVEFQPRSSRSGWWIAATIFATRSAGPGLRSPPISSEARLVLMLMKCCLVRPVAQVDEAGEHERLAAGHVHQAHLAQLVESLDHQLRAPARRGASVEDVPDLRMAVLAEEVAPVRQMPVELPVPWGACLGHR